MISRAEHEAADYAGSQWADDNDLSQPCHWLNETIKEARAALAQPCSTIPVEEDVIREAAEYFRVAMNRRCEGDCGPFCGCWTKERALYQRLKGVSDAK